MSYAHKLRYAGEKPYQPEIEREDITAEEMELLEQDETYRKLAEVRWLASELEQELAVDVDANWCRAYDALFDAVGASDAPLQKMVGRYVNEWLAECRRQEEADR